MQRRPSTSLSKILHPLERLEDDFEHFELVGSGKFGKVYRVVCKKTGLVYAAKHIECRRASEKRRVWDEIEILQSIEHCALVRLYGVYSDYTDNGSDEIVEILEYLPGGELFNRILQSTDRMITEMDIAGFIYQILTGVDYLHSHNIVHLDLKPENIVCLDEETFEIKLVDFGLARRLDDSQATCVMQGTPDFVCPEVVNYEPISTSSDMWSVGVITYVLLSGLSPFLGDSNMQTFNNITNLNFTFEEDEFDPVSSLAKDFILKLLVLNPPERMSASEALNHQWITSKDDTKRSLFYPYLTYPRTTTMVSLKTIVVYSDESMDESDEEHDMNTNRDDFENTVLALPHNNNFLLNHLKTFLSTFSSWIPVPQMLSVSNFFITKFGSITTYSRS